MRSFGVQQYLEKFGNQRIRRRIPYTLPGDLTIPASVAAPRAFADGTFYHGVELPFEVTRMTPKVISLDGNGLDQTDPSIGSLLHLVLLQVKLLGGARDLTAVATRIITLVDDDTGSWEFDAPITLKQKDGFVVFGTNNIPVANAAGGCRIEVTFKGSLLELEG